MEIGQFDVNYVGLFRGRKKSFSRRFVVLVFAKAHIILTYNIRVRGSFYKELASELDSFSNKNTMAMEGVMVYKNVFFMIRETIARGRREENLTFRKREAKQISAAGGRTSETGTENFFYPC